MAESSRATGRSAMHRPRAMDHGVMLGRDERPSLSSGYVNIHDAPSRESSSANTPASTALTASAVREVTFSLRIAARSC